MAGFRDRESWQRRAKLASLFVTGKSSQFIAMRASNASGGCTCYYQLVPDVVLDLRCLTVYHLICAR